MRYRGERAHLQLEDFVDGVDFALEAVGRGHGGGAFAKLGGRQYIARLVDQRASEVLSAAQYDAFVDAMLNFCLGFRVLLIGENGDLANGLVFAVAAVDIDIEVGDQGAFGDGSCGAVAGQGFEVLIGQGFVFGEGDGQVEDAAGFGEADSNAGAFADVVDGE